MVWITLCVVKLIRLAKNFNAVVDNKTKQSPDDKSELDHKIGSGCLELDAPFPLHSNLGRFFVGFFGGHSKRKIRNMNMI